MDVTQVKSQVSEALKAKNMGATAGMVRAGSFGQDQPQPFPIIPIVAVGAVMLGAVGAFMFRPNQAVQQTATGQAQIDMSMAMLANQQEINDRLLQGQQELSRAIIENAKPDHTTILCIGSRMCPGNAPSDGGVMVQPNEPMEPQAYPDPVTSVVHVSDVDRAWSNHYQQLRQSNETAFNADWRECIRQDWLPVTPQINCPALSKELQR